MPQFQGQLLKEKYKSRAAERQRDSSSCFQPLKPESKPKHHTKDEPLERVAQIQHQSKTLLLVV